MNSTGTTTALSVLLTLAVLAGCNGDEVGSRADDSLVLCDDAVRGYVIVRGVARRGTELSDNLCAKRLMLFALETHGVQFTSGALDAGEIAGAAAQRFVVDEVRPGEAIPLGIPVERNALPKHGQRIAWSECTTQIARGVFTNDDGWAWFEGHVEPTNGYTIGRHSVDTWWPDERQDVDDANVHSIVGTPAVGVTGTVTVGENTTLRPYFTTTTPSDTSQDIGERGERK